MIEVKFKTIEDLEQNLGISVILGLEDLSKNTRSETTKLLERFV